MEVLQSNTSLIKVLEDKTNYGLCELCLDWSLIKICTAGRDCDGAIITFSKGEDVALCEKCYALYNSGSQIYSGMFVDPSIEDDFPLRKNIIALIKSFGISVYDLYYVDPSCVGDGFNKKTNLLLEIPSAPSTTYFKDSTTGKFTLQQKWQDAHVANDRAQIVRLYTDKIARILIMLARIHHAPRSPFNIWVYSSNRFYSIELWSTLSRKNIRLKRGSRIKVVK